MKKKIFLISIFVSIYFLTSAFSSAQTPTPDAEQIKDQLIENIASRVAELDLVEKRGIVGTTVETANTQITLTDLNNETRFVDVDELTKFSSQDEDDFGISDITPGSQLSVIGLYNKESRRILARFVNVVTLPKYIYGTVNEIDTTNRTLTVETAENETVNIDIGNSTTILSYTSEDDLSNDTFSGIEINMRIVIAGYDDINTEGLVVADRIILLPEIGLTPTPDQTQSATESAR